MEHVKAYVFPGDPKKNIEPFLFAYDEQQRVWTARELPPGGELLLPQLPDDFRPKPLPPAGEEVIQLSLPFAA